MPTKKPQWAEMAKASEEELLQYKGIKSSHLVLLPKPPQASPKYSQASPSLPSFPREAQRG